MTVYALRSQKFVALDTGGTDVTPGVITVTAAGGIPSNATVPNPTITLGAADSRPTGPQYVTWESLNPTSSLTFKQVLAAVPSGKILTLPSGTFTIGSDFDSATNYTCCKVPSNVGGIVGSGPTATILQMQANSSTKAGIVPTTEGQTNPCQLMRIVHSNFQFKNLQVKGTAQGHLYGGVQIGDGSVQYQTGVVIDTVKFVNCAPGNANFPPGETFQLDFNWNDGAQVLNCEMDGKNPSTGLPESASPLGFNNCINSYVQDTYCHDAATSMPTFWRCRNIHTLRLRSELNGSGNGLWSGCGVNHEQCDGTILHESATLKPGYGTTGTHGTRTSLMLGFFNNDGTHTQPTTITVNGIVHDAGPDGGISVSSNQSPMTIIKNGVTLAQRPGGSGGDPNTFYWLYS